MKLDHDNELLTIEIDKELDLLTAHFKEIENPLETEASSLFDGSILFKYDSVSGELVQIIIYDFSIIRRKLLFKLIFLYTTHSIKNWLKILLTGFQSGKKAHQYAQHKHSY